MKSETDVKQKIETVETKSKNDSVSLSIQRYVKSFYDKVNSFSFDFNQVKTDYSAPDSIGRQYPTSKTETKGKAVSSSHESSQIDDKVLIQFNEITKSMDSIKTTVSTVVKQNQELKAKLNWFERMAINVGYVVIGLAIAILLFWLCRRFKIMRL